MKLVLGMGNPLRGDDGVGNRVIEMLKECDLPVDVLLLDVGTPGLGLVSQLHEWAQSEGGQVTLIDAVCMGQAPGTWRRFTLEEVKRIASNEPLSLHQIDLADSLVLADSVGVLSKQIVIYGVEPAYIDWTLGLSPEVNAGLPELVQNILSELREV